MAKDLVVIEKIEKRLREKQTRDSEVFPLSPTHRKELRKLRDSNIGELRNRIRAIKEMKRNEFIKKYDKQAKKIEAVLNENAAILNKKFDETAKKVKSLLNGFREFEQKIGLKGLSISRNYDLVSGLDTFEPKRKYSLSTDAVRTEIAKKFDEKFGAKFKEIDDKLDLMLTQYEEAINFGDLQIVKELYYGLKDADKFLDSIAKIKV